MKPITSEFCDLKLPPVNDRFNNISTSRNTPKKLKILKDGGLQIFTNAQIQVSAKKDHFGQVTPWGSVGTVLDQYSEPR